MATNKIEKTGKNEILDNITSMLNFLTGLLCGYIGEMSLLLVNTCWIYRVEQYLQSNDSENKAWDVRICVCTCLCVQRERKPMWQ